MTLTQPINDWSARRYQDNAAFVPALGAPVLALLAPRPGERILDLGCGDGALTEKLVAAGAHVHGVDSSADMIAAAQARGLSAEVMDGQALTFAADYDAVFSNAALHWMLDHEAVASGVYRTLRPGGRFVGEFGGFGNIAGIRTAVRAAIEMAGYAIAPEDAQRYGEPDAFAALLQAAGFVAVEAALIARPTPLPTGLAGWLETFRQGFIDPWGVAEADVPAVIARAQALAAPALRQGNGQWVADYVRLRFSARKPD